MRLMSEAERVEKLWRDMDGKGPDECWRWHGLKNRTGYGLVQWTENGRRRAAVAHAFSYQLLRGDIPVGLELDHLCRNRWCVNPWHLEAVTHQENIRRGRTGAPNKSKTHCPSGHEYTEANTLYKERGKYIERHCRRCSSLHSMAYHKRNPGKKVQWDRDYHARKAEPRAIN